MKKLGAPIEEVIKIKFNSLLKLLFTAFYEDGSPERCVRGASISFEGFPCFCFPVGSGAQLRQQLRLKGLLLCRCSLQRCTPCLSISRRSSQARDQSFALVRSSQCGLQGSSSSL